MTQDVDAIDMSEKHGRVSDKRGHEWVGLTAEDLSVWPPPKRERVGLTDEEIFVLGDEHGWYDDFGRWTFNGAGLIKFVLAIKTAAWVGLTDDDLTCLFLSAEGERVAKYIEFLLKEKNT